jgi:IMP dehydrogenase
MVRILTEPGRTFAEFSLLPGLTTKKSLPQNVDLTTKLAGLELKIPLLSAAMTSVTGYNMAIALGKEGGLGVLPARMTIDNQSEIVKKVKSYQMGFVEDPLSMRNDASIENVLEKIVKYGHSKIPIVDRNNEFKGMFTMQHYWNSVATPEDKVIDVMIPRQNVKTFVGDDTTVEQAKKMVAGQGYVVIMDEKNRLVKIAFEKDVNEVKVGAAISTHKGWQERVEAVVEAGVDLIIIDTSDAHNIYVHDTIKEYKAMKHSIPLCAGNVVTKEGALYLINSGADIVKVGMSSGSICTTRREKSVGRSPMSALLDVKNAMEEITFKYVPIIMDGGISSAADMVIALTHADAIMMGGYFNHFYEAAADKLDVKGQPTNSERNMKWVETWGEGSAKAQNLDRYSQTRKTFFTEGEEGKVEYRGMLKPNLKDDLHKVRAALSNAGCEDLITFRSDAVIELMSPYSNRIVGDTHNMKTKA